MTKLKIIDSEGIVREHAENLQGTFCSRPFDWLVLNEEASLLCCAPWSGVNVGDPRSDSLFEMFNSDAAQRVRQSVLDGTYEYCNHNICPYLLKGRLPQKSEVTNPRHRNIIDNNLTTVSDGPAVISLSYDRSCNLTCPSCRTEKIQENSGEVYEMRLSMQQRILDDLFRDNPQKAVRFVVSESGDAFGSKVFRDFLFTFDGQKHPNVEIEIKTNGVMFTPAYWHKMHKLHGNINSIIFSFDAAREKTYRDVRRGGDWEQMLKNFAFLSELRAEGKVECLTINCVVQQKNFREIAELVKLAKSFPKVDAVVFTIVVDWGTWDKEDYEFMCIWKQTHPEFEDFLTELQNPIFEDRIVQLANLTPYRQLALKRKSEKYAELASMLLG